jgi:hypothetical protein
MTFWNTPLFERVGLSDDSIVCLYIIAGNSGCEASARCFTVQNLFQPVPNSEGTGKAE